MYEKLPDGVRPLRRVVTGHDERNVAKVLLDDELAQVKRGKSGWLFNVWSTAGTPAEIPVGEAIDDPARAPHETPPPERGTRFVVMEYPPGNGGAMHRTETLDYVIVLEGEVDMDLDDSTVTLRAGDVLVQRGTNHSWVNRGTRPARVAFVLVDAEPLGIGHPRLRADSSVRGRP